MATALGSHVTVEAASAENSDGDVLAGRAYSVPHQQTVNELVQGLFEDQTIQIWHVATTANPFDDTNPDMDIYADNRDYEYWIDAPSGRLIQAGPRSGSHQTAHPTRPVKQLPIPDLRAKALDLADRFNPGMKQQLSSFHPYECRKETDLFIFRWERGIFENNGAPPPLIQITLRADGQLMALTDTLKR